VQAGTIAEELGTVTDTFLKFIKINLRNKTSMPKDLKCLHLFNLMSQTFDISNSKYSFGSVKQTSKDYTIILQRIGRFEFILEVGSKNIDLFLKLFLKLILPVFPPLDGSHRLLQIFCLL